MAKEKPFAYLAYHLLIKRSLEYVQHDAVGQINDAVEKAVDDLLTMFGAPPKWKLFNRAAQRVESTIQLRLQCAHLNEATNLYLERKYFEQGWHIQIVNVFKEDVNHVAPDNTTSEIVVILQAASLIDDATYNRFQREREISREPQ